MWSTVSSRSPAAAHLHRQRFKVSAAVSIVDRVSVQRGGDAAGSGAVTGEEGGFGLLFPENPDRRAGGSARRNGRNQFLGWGSGPGCWHVYDDSGPRSSAVRRARLALHVHVQDPYIARQLSNLSGIAPSYPFRGACPLFMGNVRGLDGGGLSPKWLSRS